MRKGMWNLPVAVLGAFSFMLGISQVSAQTTPLKNFQGTSQRVALVGIFNEFVEPSVEDSVVKDAREIIGKYSATYKVNEIANFKTLSNPSNQYFKTSPGELSETQKQFLQKACQDNAMEIVVLNTLRQNQEGLEMEVQLYDSRIETLSAIETARFSVRDRRKGLEDLFYRIFNYLDRDGFVHPDPQDMLEKPSTVASLQQEAFGPKSIEEEMATDPEFLGRGELADDASIGGEQTPFWEKWWFWTAIGGSIITASALSYYFLVVDQPPNRAKVRFNMPARQ